jgi:hypothetical protein
MYHHINTHINTLLDLLQEDRHVEGYDNLMRRFQRVDAAEDEEFQKLYIHFWGLRGLRGDWHQRYFRVLQKIRREPAIDLAQLLEYICHQTLGVRGSKQTVEFSFAAKMAHMVAPDRAPIYDDRVRAFYFLPDTAHKASIDARIQQCLRAHDALVKEYGRVLQNRVLDKPIACFRKKLNPERFVDMKIIDSLIWAFVTWARGDRRRRPAYIEGTLQY